MCTVQLNDHFTLFNFGIMLFICFFHLLFLNWLIKSDKKIISQIFMTIFTDKQKAKFNSMRWQDAFSWFPIELLSTELQWSNY